MIKERIKEISKNVKFDEPMKNHTTFKIGGNADIFCEPESVCELRKILKAVKEENTELLIVGNGSNMLVSDKGIRGIVIKIGSKMAGVKIDNEYITAESGILLSKLASAALNNELTGFENFSGIPGSLGGALYMNAGAYGSEMSDVIEKVDFIDENGEIKTLKKEQLDFGYRKSIFTSNNYVIVSATLRLKKGNAKEIESKMKELSKMRSEKQPLNLPSAGSVFKRPVGYFAGKLIEDCGLKGYSIGGAKISEKHAGFIVNYNNATAKDVLDLIEYAHNVVFEKFGVSIEPEIKLIGEK